MHQIERDRGRDEPAREAPARGRAPVLDVATTGSHMAAAASPLRWALLRSSSFLLLLAFLQPRASHCLDNGVALTPPMAWTSWNLARFDVSAEMVLGMADALEKTGLKALGWDTLQIDEGWEACESYAGPHPGAWPKNFLTSCATPAPRDAKGWIVANETKFPGGIKAIADTLHGRGFKVGVYTSASERACGGNWGSHGHEAADAAAFEAWGVCVDLFFTCCCCCCRRSRRRRRRRRRRRPRCRRRSA
jgi:alpha-galactosidase